MKRLGHLLAILILCVSGLFIAPQQVRASSWSLLSAPTTSPVLGAEVSRRNRADEKLATEFGKKLDLNNSTVRQFRQYPGLYPTLARLVIDNAPYKQVEDVLKIPGLTATQKEVLENNLDNFTITEVESIFIEGARRINSGVYD